MPTWAAGAGAAIAALIVGILAPLVLQRHSPQPPARDQTDLLQRIVSLKAEAEQLALAGKLAEAHARYQQIEQLAAGQKTADKSLLPLLDSIRQDQGRIFARLLENRETASISAEASSQHARQTLVPNAAATLPADSSSEPNEASGRPTVQPPGPAQVATPATTVATQPAGSTAGALPVIPQPGNWTPPEQSPAEDGLTDAQIGQSIKRASEFIIRHIRDGRIEVEGRKQDTYMKGLNALCVWALLNASQTIQDDRLDIRGPFMKELIQRMKADDYLAEAGNPRAPVTYARSLRACALAVYNRAEDRAKLKEDVQWLIQAATAGSYTYNDAWARALRVSRSRTTDKRLPNPMLEPKLPGAGPHESEGDPGLLDGPGLSGLGSWRDGLRGPLVPWTLPLQGSSSAVPWDNSNTQYGVLGVWSGAEAGIEVPQEYWKAVESHWTRCQTSTGEWGYDARQTQGYFAMTVAGIASLFVTHDYLAAPALGTEAGRQPFSQPLARGMAWLEAGDNALSVMQNVRYLGYNLFGLERVGLASGFKYFGQHEWYRKLASRVIALQRADGSWCRDLPASDTLSGGNPVCEALVDTSYILLFLARGRHPILMNKLRFDGYWANRPREISNLAKYASRELERPLNWQVVTLKQPWHEWLDSPVLFIASHQAPRLDASELVKLRQFVLAGGLVFTHSDGGSAAFSLWVQETTSKLFPDYPLEALPPTHEIYSVQYRLSEKPPLRAVSNGSRLLWIHSPQDLSGAWQLRSWSKRESWDLGVNIFLYAAGKGDLRNRLNSPYLPPMLLQPAARTGLARLKYAGNWDPEPFAWERFARYLEQHTGILLEPTTIDLQDLGSQSPPLAHMTGTAAFVASEVQVQGIRRYVEAGGMVLIDACGGSSEFTQSILALMNRAFPEKKPSRLDGKHPLLNATFPAMEDLTGAAIRPFAQGKVVPAFEMIRFGRGVVLLSPLDLTTGLLGTNTWAVTGYQPGYCEKLVKNWILWVANGARS